MGSQERRQRVKENLRRDILDAARDLFVTHGYEAVTLRKIAEKIEYSPTTIYLHFQDKEEILSALVEEGFQKMAQYLEVVHGDDPIERLRRGARRYLSFAREQPHYYTIMFEMNDTAHSLSKKNGQPRATDLAGQRAFQFIVGGVEEGIAKGLIHPEPSALVQAHTVWACIHGAASLRLAGRLGMMDEADWPVFLEDVVENTLRGLQSAASGSGERA